MTLIKYAIVQNGIIVHSFKTYDVEQAIRHMTETGLAGTLILAVGDQDEEFVDTDLTPVHLQGGR